MHSDKDDDEAGATIMLGQVDETTKNQISCSSNKNQ